MDPMVAKIVVSRKKSIATLEAEVSKLESLVKTASTPSAAVALGQVVTTKRQRLAKLRDELAGLESLDQVELPGVGRARK